MENRFALAVVFRGDKDNYLFGLRSIELDEYPDKWSLPSTTISRAAFEETRETGYVPQSAIDRLIERCFKGRFTLKLRYLRFCKRERDGYLFHLALVQADFEQPPLPNESKYQRLRFANIQEILAFEDGCIGTCISLLIQDLVEDGDVESSIQYLEVPPTLLTSRGDIGAWSPIELWKSAIPNYSFLRAGGNGSDGELIRSLTLDRYINRRFAGLDRKKECILDVGCGDGRFVSYMTKLGYNCSGVDIIPDPQGFYKDEHLDLRSIRAEELADSFPSSSVSFVVLNLVVQWIEDLQKLTFALSEVTQPNAKILLTLVPPAFAKNGFWDQSSGNFDWVVNEPVRRKSFLTMINRTVGPVMYFPRTIPDYISAFGKSRMPCISAEYIYMDSFLEDDERDLVYSKHPHLKRHERIPPFLVMEFERLHKDRQ